LSQGQEEIALPLRGPLQEDRSLTSVKAVCEPARAGLETLAVTA
jgi:hypothetical protein